MRPASGILSRREALKRAALLLGGAISAPTIAGVLAGCGRAGEGAATAARSLSPERRDLVAAIAEQILPETDTPGARAAGVHDFVEAMLSEFYPEEERARFLAGLDALERRSQRELGTGFLAASPRQQAEFLAALDREVFAKPAQPPRDPTRNPVTQRGDVATGRSHPPGSVSASGAVTVDAQRDPEDVGTGSFWRTMKELTLVGYYTSEAGATQELRVNPMGRYRGDVSYSEIGQAWA